MVSSVPVDVVDSYFRAMQKGPAEVAQLVDLFAGDAVYIEPFTGSPVEHRGRASIRAYFEAAMPQNPPDLTVSVDRVDVDGDRVRTEWSCTASIFPARMHGVDQFVIADGKIQRLETAMVL